MEQIKAYLSKLKKNNKGSSYLYKVTEYLTLMFILAFLLDVTVLLGQFMVVSYHTAFYSDVFAIQGGLVGATKIDTNEPSDAVIFGSSEMTNYQIISKINEMFRGFGIAENEWKMTVNDRTIYNYGDPSATDIVTSDRLTFRQRGDVIIEFKYRWRFASAILPGAIQNTVTTTSSYISEWFEY